MKSRSPILVLIVIILGLVVSSCGFKAIEFKNIKDLNIESNKKTGQNITATLTLYNPNNHSFTIKDLDIDVYLKQAYLGKLVINDTVVVNKKSEFTTECIVTVKKENLFVAGAALFGSLGKKGIEVSMKGTMNIHYIFLNREVNIDHSEKVRL